MSVLSFVRELARKDIKLWLDGERLRVNAPEGMLTPVLVAELKARKAELVAFLQEHKDTTPVVTIERQARPERLPLSFSQQRLWFLSQLEGASSAYNIHAALRLDGPLDVADFHASWQALEARHESLRTTFPQADGRAYQQIHPPSSQVHLIDLTGLSAVAQQGEVTRLARQAAAERFDLERGPLWNVSLLRLNPTAHVLLVTMHHIISDGWSIGILTRELWALYTARAGKTQRAAQATHATANLPELPLQYADFTLWQRAWLTGDRLKGHLDYWTTQLAGAPPLLTLPTDRPRPTAQSHRGAELSVTWPDSLYQGVRSLAQKEGATLFMTLHAAFAILLSRYAGQEDLCIGTPIANRTLAEIENLVGFFVNTLVLRSNLQGNPSFRDFLARTRQTTLDAYQHQELPFELLVEALRPARTLSHSPLFQVLFALQNAPTVPAAFGELRASHIDVESNEAKFDLTLTIHERPECLIAVFRYSTDVFFRTTIERMAGHLQNLLEGIVRNSEQPVFHLPLLGEREQKLLLTEWNDTARPYPLEVCVHELFEQQVGKTPEAIAVVCEQQRFTYAELDARTNRLAHHLRSLGVGPEVRVAICFERSAEVVVAMLAVLKAGGAYVPLDPSHPRDRLLQVCQGAEASIVVTNTTHRGLVASAGTHLVDLDAEAISAAPAGPLQSGANPSHLAYVLFTSGSTGIPKGVGITHQNLVNYVHGLAQRVEFPANATYAHVSTFSADLGNTVLFPPLCLGGTLHVISQDAVMDAHRMGAYFDEHRIDCLKIAPSHLSALMSGPHPERVLPRKILILGGEASTWEFIERIANLSPNTRIFNHYGPTETTVGVVMHGIERDRRNETAPTVPLGRPLPNSRVYVLDAAMTPVPIGISGELYIGGAGVARGYLGRLDLTAERFVPDPFGSPGSRMYRTGDLCRFRADGNLEFLGRIDHQVKIRGFRVELGEIEAVLFKQAHVRDAVVIAQKDERGTRLIAYVVLHPDEPKSPPPAALEELRGALQRALPDYMIPSAFVPLAALPLSPNGKLDRSALPAPEERRAEAARVLPRTPTEITLLAIWQEVLCQKSIGVTDNFFQVGGDSILSIQIVSRAREAGLQITPKLLFQHQTVAELANVARPLGTTQAEQGIVTGSVPLTPIQRRFFAQEWSEPHHYNQAVLLELHATADADWLAEALRHLLVHHDGLRLRFARDEGGFRQWLADPSTDVPFQVIDLSDCTPHEQAWRQDEESNRLQRSLDLSKGPLLRAALFRRTSGMRLLIVIHHLVVDGVSWRILIEDLQKVYQQLAQGLPVVLPPKSTSFKAWAARLQEMGPGLVEDEREYWQQVETCGAGRLPIDYRRGPNDYAAAASFATCLDPAWTAVLLNVVPSVYHTQINDLLLTALGLSLRAFSGQTTLRIDLEGHGREELFSDDDADPVDLSRTIGWFTSIFPVHLDLSLAGMGETIKSVKEQLRQVPRRGIGYGILRYLSADAADLEATSDPDVSFNYLGQFDQFTNGPLIKAILPESGGLARSPLGPRAHLLDLTGIVSDGQLQVQWVYSQNFHRRETIQRLADSFMDNLRALLAHCQSPGAGGFTPSDFPDAKLAQSTLDQLLREIGLANGKTGAGSDWLEDLYPLSPSQQGILIESVMKAHSGIHIEQTVFDWQGPMNLPALLRAWQYVLARHPILRTGFVWEGLPSPLQFVLRKVQLPIEHHSLLGLPREEQQAHINEHIAAERRRGLELMLAPLLRLSLFELAPNIHHVVFTRHHILTDGWSIPIVFRELLSAYQVECDSRTPQWKPSRPYHDYIRWLMAQSLTRSESFWRSELQGFRSPTPLATRPGGEKEAQRYASLDAVLPATDTDKLIAVGQRHGLTTNTLTQAAWALLLGQHSGTSDVVFGATVSGRPPELADVETIVGLFVNTLPIRARLAAAADEPLASWLRTLQAQGMEQQSHAYCSAGQIHGWSEVPGALPLYESVLVFENYPIKATAEREPEAPGALPPTKFEICDVGSIGAQTQHALTALVTPGEELRFRVVYDAVRFAESDLHRMLAQWLRLLARLAEGLATAPQEPLRGWLQPEEKAPTVHPFHPQSPKEAREFVPPRSEFERKLVHIFAEVLGVHSVSVRHSFFELGGHSLLAVRLMARIQQHFGQNLPLATLFHAPTIEQLASRIRELAAGQKADWSILVPIQPSGNRLPLFCLPGAGGNVLYLYELAHCLGAEQPLYGLQAVGLDGETVPFSSVEEMAAHNIAAIRRIRPQGPYVLGGHSFGGKVAFEMARQLLRAGQEVARVLLFDSSAPSDVSDRPEANWDETRWLVGLAEGFALMFEKKTALDYEALLPLHAEERMLRLKEELVRLELLAPSADLKQVRGWLDVYKSNLLTSYQPGPAIAVPITLFRAAELLSKNKKTMQDHQEPTLGWEPFVRDSVEVITVPGNHVSMMVRPYVETLAARISTCMQHLEKPSASKTL